MGMVGKYIAQGGGMPARYGEALLKDLPKDKAARFPVADGKTIVTNHPVFVYGHLSLYISRILGLVGLPVERWEKPAGWEELFNAGVECKDDAAGTLYPELETVSSFFINGQKHLLKVLPEVNDEVFAQINPSEASRERMPNVGGVVNLLAGPHATYHLGQISAWRRFQGLGSAM